MAEVRSLCHICGNVANKVCRLCGRPTCDKHIDSNTGICSSHTGAGERTHKR